MRVLFVANSDWGLYNFRLHIAKALRDRGVEVVLVCPEGPYSQRMRDDGYRVLPWNLQRRSLGPVSELRALLRLTRLYRQETPDLVHHHTIKVNVYGLIAARLARIPRVINTWTGLGYAFSSGFLAAAIRLFVIPIARWLAKDEGVYTVVLNHEDFRVLHRRGLINASRASVILSEGIDTSRFAARDGRAGESHQDQTLTVLMAARLLRAKGVAELVATARSLRERGIHVRIVIAGAPDPGNPGSFSDQEIARMGRGSDVEFLGHVEDMPALLREADIAVLPTYYNEGVPVFLLEAAASGLPLVATDIEGCRVIVRPGVNGLIVPAKDPSALAGAIATLVADPALRARMGAASREIAVSEFGHARVIEQYLDVYRAVGVLS